MDRYLQTILPLPRFLPPRNPSTMAPRHLNFITGNANKLKEVKAILGDTVDLQSQNVDLLEIQGTIEEVSIHKARSAADTVSPGFEAVNEAEFALIFSLDKRPSSG